MYCKFLSYCAGNIDLGHYVFFSVVVIIFCTNVSSHFTITYRIFHLWSNLGGFFLGAHPETVLTVKIFCAARLKM